MSDTIVDRNRTRPAPDARMIRAGWRVFFRRAIMRATRQIAAPIRGYRSKVLRCIVPEAFPWRSKWAGRISGREVQRMAMANAFMATIMIGIFINSVH